METKTKITWEEVKELLPKTVSLYYVDYRDDLDEHMGLLQECIHEGVMDSLWEKVDEWYVDGADTSYYRDKLRNDLQNKFDLENDEVDEIMEEFDDDIRDTLYDRDDSDVVKDLIRNTSKQAMFYDTGYEVAPDSWSWSEKEIKKERQDIKRQLGLRALTEQQNNDIDMMIRQASYGGRLVIYFYDSVDDFIAIDGDYKVITFKNPHIAIIDNCGGSGDHCYVGGVTVKLPLEKENIFICEATSYSYTHDVCGMVSNWCDGTTVGFVKPKLRNKRKVTESSLNAHLERDKKLNETYRKGGCTAGDMDITRHRNAVYVNDYPCGNRCKDCGTFWID
jgi:hypothetical protein